MKCRVGANCPLHCREIQLMRGGTNDVIWRGTHANRRGHSHTVHVHVRRRTAVQHVCVVCTRALTHPSEPRFEDGHVRPRFGRASHLDGIQRMYCGWDPSAQSGGSKSEQVKHCMDLEHCVHWLHLEPTHLLYYTVCTGYTWSPLTYCTTLSALATLQA
jgi:hypothetical protein